MAQLQFHTEEMPMYEDIGARYVVIAHFDGWRDGEVTSDSTRIPQLKRELFKRFLQRLNA